MEETKAETKGSGLLDLNSSGGQKDDSKLMLMLQCVCWKFANMLSSITLYANNMSVFVSISSSVVPKCLKEIDSFCFEDQSAL